MLRFGRAAGASLWMTLAAAPAPGAAAAPPAAAGQELLKAVRAGDVAAARALLDQGVPVDTRFRYDRTALSFAADRGQAEMVSLLLERGADPRAADTFYKVTPVFWAADHGHLEVVKLLLARDPSGAGTVLDTALDKVSDPRSLELVRLALATRDVEKDELSSALERAEAAQAAGIVEALRAAGAVLPPKGDFAVDAALLPRYTGAWRDADDPAFQVEVSMAEGALQASLGGRSFKLGGIDDVTFRPLGTPGFHTFTFEVADGRATRLVLKHGRQRRTLEREEGRP